MYGYDNQNEPLKTDAENDRQTVLRAIRQHHRILIAALIVCVAAFLFYIKTGSSGYVSAEMDNSSLGVAGKGFQATFIPLQEIDSVEMVDYSPDISLETGETTSVTLCGTFFTENGTAIRIYCYRKVPKCICVKWGGETILFNRYSEKETANFLEKLKNAANTAEK
jgi:hypothetical protein